jgi:hypothetical protein
MLFLYPFVSKEKINKIYSMKNAHSIYGNYVSLLIIVLNTKYIVYVPIKVCLFCLLRICLRRFDLERLRVVR